MRMSDVYIAGAAVALPGRLTTAEALADGRCDAATARRTGLSAVTVSSGRSPSEMAADAAREALERAGAAPENIDLILHANVYYQGHDLWAPASYIQRTVVGNRCLALEVRQMSNGGMAALELACGYLSLGGRTSGALLTAADRFAEPGFDRWRSDPGTVYGDGGSALVLSRHDGFARLRSITTVADAELEQMHRGDDPFSVLPFACRRPIDVDVLKRQFVERVGISYSINRVSTGQAEALKGALADADVEFGDISWFVLPHLGLKRLTATFLRPWGIDVAATTWDWASTVGHLGAGDQYAGLTHLVRTGRVRPGQLVLMAGVGAGFSWSCAVVEIRHLPPWAVG